MEYTMYMIVAIVAVLAYIEIASLKKQVRALSEQVHTLAQAQQLKAAGKAVAAVRVVREATGMSLEDAKRWIDEL